MAIAQVVDLVKTYRMGAVEVHALRGVDLAINEGDYMAIMGPSGSGKSTFLNLLGCLDTPTRGSYFLGEQDVARLSDAQLSHIRCHRIGFIFQSYNLIQQLSVVENIEVPLYYQGRSAHE
ncbi:ABC transporter ATP-binding protein, partial [bacterium]|nr:ABC transporter ATP-binding protein [bacterium]